MTQKRNVQFVCARETDRQRERGGGGGGGERERERERGRSSPGDEKGDKKELGVGVSVVLGSLRSAIIPGERFIASPDSSTSPRSTPPLSLTPSLH